MLPLVWRRCNTWGYNEALLRRATRRFLYANFGGFGEPVYRSAKEVARYPLSIFSILPSSTYDRAYPFHFHFSILTTTIMAYG
eukprot:scaffold3181_cov184-Skeletonema_menzelii.AAC.1